MVLDQSDSVMYRLLLSEAITGLSFDFVSCIKHAERFFTIFFGFFRNFFLVRPDFTKVEHFLNENMENISIIQNIQNSRQAAKKYTAKSLISVFLKDRNTKQYLMITVMIMKKQNI